MKFQDPSLINKANEYTDDPDYLVAYHAREALGLDVQELVIRGRKKKAKWWQFW